ncbi:lasso peptide biosynthesis PqqD family chaperone [Actinomadura sp. 9N407]|uniref:lasso peptide biosynthesis PqqD family chaperone n=1 Tax=Actinomadura sp. 9N407 TaxID=3375154 RepID=UPI00378DF350
MTIALAQHVSIAETEHGMVLLDQRTGRYWQLNGTGATVVRTLQDGGTVDQAISGLTERFPDAATRVAADVSALVDSLRAARMLAS